MLQCAQMSPEPGNNHFPFLVEESRKILDDRELIYDLAGKRLALRAIELKGHLSDPANAFHLAIVGNPNRSKTTYAYSCYSVLKTYDVPVKYHDLDVYTQSGMAISGVIDWNKRVKRTLVEIEEKEISQSIQTFINDTPGIIIGDYPGRIKDQYQAQRLEKADLAIILAKDSEEVKKWAKLCTSLGVGYRWLISETEPPLPYEVLYPSFYNLTREVRFSPMMLVSATSILEEIAAIKDIPLSNIESYFSQAELVVLQEILDFHFSIRNV